MRGGAIPLLAWGTLLLVLLLGNWVWTEDTIQVGLFAMATGIIYATAARLTAGIASGSDAGAGGPRRTAWRFSAMNSAAVA